MTQMRIAPRRYTRRRRARRTPLLALLAVAAVGLVALAAAALFAASTPAAAADPATSTPRSAWRAGEVPHLYQTDPAWSGEPYAGGTVEKNGCGPTCLSMAYVTLTGKTDLDPAQMAAFAEDGGYTQDGMTTWTLMSEGAERLGLDSEELPADADAVRDALRSEKVIICSVRPGDFTTTGHFIVLAGLADDGKVEVRDPNSAKRSRAWDLERVLDQCANLWALSA